MKIRMVRSFLGVLLICSFRLAPAVDRPWLEMESRYAGDGWFRYRITSLWCPFIESINVTSIAPNYTNWTELGPPPARWSFTNHYASWGWEVDVGYPHWQVRPYEAVFEARSSWTNYTRGIATVLMSLSLYELSGYSPYVSANVVGYWNAPALVPCLEAPTNVMPALLYTNIPYNADILIRQLVRDGQETRGIEFSYDTAATLLLEATPDLENWRKVSYLHGLPGTNQWRTNTDLGRWGNFYRLEYVGYGHLPLTNLPPLDLPTDFASRTARPTKKPAGWLSAFSENQNLKVRMQTAPGRNYEVRVYHAGEIAWSLRLVAKQNETVVTLPAGRLPAFGIISALELP